MLITTCVFSTDRMLDHKKTIGRPTRGRGRWLQHQHQTSDTKARGDGSGSFCKSYMSLYIYIYMSYDAKFFALFELQLLLSFVNLLFGVLCSFMNRKPRYFLRTIATSLGRAQDQYTSLHNYMLSLTYTTYSSLYRESKTQLSTFIFKSY